VLHIRAPSRSLKFLGWVLSVPCVTTIAHSADETEAPDSEGSGNEGGNEENLSKVTKCRRDNPTSKTCPFCEKSMHPKSLARHCREMHDTEIVNVGTCVDEQHGLFLI